MEQDIASRIAARDEGDDALLDRSINPSPLKAFAKFSHWLWQSSQKTSGLTPETRVDALYAYLTQEVGLPPEDTRQRLQADYEATGARGLPDCLRGWISHRGKPLTKATRGLAARQAQHANG